MVYLLCMVYLMCSNFGNTQLSVLLQQIESYLVLKIICKRITNEKPRLPIFTIHDSVVTTAGHEEYVDAVIKEELEKAIGIPPAYKIEYWKPENLKFDDGTFYNASTGDPVP